MNDILRRLAAFQAQAGTSAPNVIAVDSSGDDAVYGDDVLASLQASPLQDFPAHGQPQRPSEPEPGPPDIPLDVPSNPGPSTSAPIQSPLAFTVPAVTGESSPQIQPPDEPADSDDVLADFLNFVQASVPAVDPATTSPGSQPASISSSASVVECAVCDTVSRGSADDGQCIACDTCGKWSHLDCVSRQLSLAEDYADHPWHCPRCHSIPMWSDSMYVFLNIR